MNPDRTISQHLTRDNPTNTPPFRRVKHPEEALPSTFTREDLLASRFKVSRVLPYQQSSPSFIGNLSLAVFSGLLLVFAFPEWNLWTLGWVAAAPLILAVVRDPRFWRSFVLGSLTGTIFYCGSSYWITYSMHHYGGISWWVCSLILVVLASCLGVFTGLFAAVLAFIVKRFSGWGILAAPAVWAASEWARAEVTGVGWNALGYSQAFMPSVIQTSRIGGVYIVSALLASAGTVLVFALVHLQLRRGLIVVTAAGVLVAATLAYGQTRLGAASSEGSVVVAAVQPNVPVDGNWLDPEFTQEMIARHIELSSRAIREASESASANGGSGDQTQHGVDLLIWPESPMNFEYDRDEQLQNQLQEYTSRQRVALLINSWGFPDGSTDHEVLYNSAVLIGDSGRKIGEYDKIALVPFGEFIPAKSWIPFMDGIQALVGDITPGSTPAVLEMPEAKIGTLICFEATRADIARQMRMSGASVLVQLSNELWFGPTSAPRQMLAHAVFRAVENDVELVRVTNSGLSTRISGDGQISDPTALFEITQRSWRVRAVDQVRGPTIYSRFGDVFAWICVLITITMMALALVRWRREKEERLRD